MTNAEFYQLISDYKAKFGETPPTMMMSWNQEKVIAQIKKAIKIGKPIEVFWPEDADTIG